MVECLSAVSRARGSILIPYKIEKQDWCDKENMLVDKIKGRVCVHLNLITYISRKHNLHKHLP